MSSIPLRPVPLRSFPLYMLCGALIFSQSYNSKEQRHTYRNIERFVFKWWKQQKTSNERERQIFSAVTLTLYEHFLPGRLKYAGQ